MPYRDFPLEYPPVALIPFVGPMLLSGEDESLYSELFALLMGCVGVALAAVVGYAAKVVGLSGLRRTVLLATLAIWPVALGTLAATHFDLWPGLLLVSALTLHLSGKQRVGGAVLGLAVATKLYPVVIVPLLLAAVARTQGRREAIIWGSIVTSAAALPVAPFVLLAGMDALHPILYQLGRPLQVESLGASALFLLHGLFELPIQVENSYGLQNLAGPLPDLLKRIEGISSVIAMTGVWAWFARGHVTPDRVVRWSAFALLVLIITDSTISPQYVMWFAPFTFLVAGRRGVVTTVVALVTTVLTTAYFPSHYWEYTEGTNLLVATIVVVRNLTFVVLAVLLVVPDRLFEKGGPIAATLRRRLRTAAPNTVS